MDAEEVFGGGGVIVVSFHLRKVGYEIYIFSDLCLKTTIVKKDSISLDDIINKRYICDVGMKTNFLLSNNDDNIK